MLSTQPCGSGSRPVIMTSSFSRTADWRSSRVRSLARGELVLDGALANPVDGAVLLFVGDSPEVAEKFAQADPYVTSGTVKRWHVREWKTVAGEDAAMPVRPDAVAANKKMLSDSSNAVGGSSAGDKGLILRMWRARSTAEKSGEYIQHATSKVFPTLRAIAGHREHTCSAARLTAPSNLSY